MYTKITIFIVCIYVAFTLLSLKSNLTMYIGIIILIIILIKTIKTIKKQIKKS